MLNTMLNLWLMDSDAIKGLADNVRRLMDKSGLSQVDLASKAKVSQKTVSDLLNYGRTSSKSPRIGTVEKLADAFGVPAWLLQIPEIPVELLQNQRIPKLLQNFLNANELGRENIYRIAESGMHYAVEVDEKKAG